MYYSSSSFFLSSLFLVLSPAAACCHRRLGWGGPCSELSGKKPTLGARFSPSFFSFAPVLFHSTIFTPEALSLMFCSSHIESLCIGPRDVVRSSKFSLDSAPVPNWILPNGYNILHLHVLLVPGYMSPESIRHIPEYSSDTIVLSGAITCLSGCLFRKKEGKHSRLYMRML